MSRYYLYVLKIGFQKKKKKRLPQWLSGKESAYNAGDTGSTTGWDDLLEEGMTTHSSIPA